MLHVELSILRILTRELGGRFFLNFARTTPALPCALVTCIQDRLMSCVYQGMVDYRHFSANTRCLPEDSIRYCDRLGHPKANAGFARHRIHVLL